MYHIRIGCLVVGRGGWFALLLADKDQKSPGWDCFADMLDEAQEEKVILLKPTDHLPPLSW